MQMLLAAIEQYGLWLVFANVLALQLGLPVPAYPTLIVIGAVSARGDFTAPQVVGSRSSRASLPISRGTPPARALAGACCD